jgi:hypothetical protein
MAYAHRLLLGPFEASPIRFVFDKCSTPGGASEKLGRTPLHFRGVSDRLQGGK